MLGIFYSIFLIFLIVSISWYIQIIKAVKWLNRARYLDHTQIKNTDKKIFIIIPVLDEVSRLEPTVNYFLDSFNNIKLVLVTTESEFLVYKSKTNEHINRLNKFVLKRNINKIKSFLETVTKQTFIINPTDNLHQILNKAKQVIENRFNTIDIVKQLKKKNRDILWYHYPYRNGKMAHQLNYAINKIISENGEDHLFAIYNADSSPHKNTITWILSYLNEHPGIEVFQQYGDYFKNVNQFKRISGGLLLSAASWQVRWSLGFEIANAIKQFKFLNRIQKKSFKSFNYPLNYCIGHGLFFTKNVFLNLNGFNEKTHNEDAIFGLELSYLQKIIMPVPYFDETDTPDTISGLFRQKINWFFGPLQAFEYFNIIKNRRKRFEIVNTVRLFILTIKLFSHALRWLLGPILFVFAALFVILNFKFLYLTIFWIEVFLLLVLPNYVSWLIINKNKNCVSTRKLKTFLTLTTFSLPFYILHGLAGYNALIKYLLSKIFNIELKKEKTEMAIN